MAEATKLVLPRLKISPSTLQYHKPRSGPPIFYKPRFSLPKEIREKTLEQPWLQAKDPLMPPYPYLQDKNRFPEANEGLYGGATIQSGSKISKGRNKGKTLRKWFPNIKVETIRSQALKKTLTIPIAARVKRTIAKCGGLDEYLLGPKPARHKELGLLGWKLRWHVMKALVEQGKLVEFATPIQSTFEQQWARPKVRNQLIQEQTKKWSDLKEKDQRFRKYMETRLLADKATRPTIPMAVKTLNILSPEMLKLHELRIREEKSTPYLSRRAQSTDDDDEDLGVKVGSSLNSAGDIKDVASSMAKAAALSHPMVGEEAASTSPKEARS